ncbi:MAG: outer membrane protein [Ignavibacteria bacterium]|nr:MAG: outer membrane protein [Ignavibacteria bacterium]KAF0160376.1 MAG: outer membrane protein [Ignavibacteria bacterium]
MKKIILSVCLFVFLSSLTEAQNKAPFGITLSGFVKSDLFYDTRQTTGIREGHFLLYPAAESLDKNNEDVNAKSNFNILSIQTRLTTRITAPDAFGAKSSGQIEGEFFGTTDGDINGFRLRHAFVKLDWTNISLLAGQTWHPMFIAEMFPSVVSFNTGAPFQPFSRNPQLRLTYSNDNIKLIAGAMSQRDFQSSGPLGFSSTYLRNSAVPNLHFQIQYLNKATLFGAGVDYKSLTPRLVTIKNIKSDESVSSFSLIGFLKFNLEPVTIKAQGIFGQNAADLMQIGGYAIKSADAVTGSETYTALSNFSAWGEISTGKEIEYAIFCGYTKALGASDNIVGAYYGRGTDIDNVIRISPRVQFNSEKNRISAELEYTSAGYGTPNNFNKGKIEKIKTVSNLRLIAAFYLFF